MLNREEIENWEHGDSPLDKHITCPICKVGVLKDYLCSNWQTCSLYKILMETDEQD